MKGPRLIKFLKHPTRILPKIILRLGKCLPDSIYLRLLYYCYFGKELNLKNPITFNEKLQWLKLNNRKREYVTLVDKVKVKDWVEEKIGNKYIIPTIAVWDKADDIDFESLPNQFVLKTNHDSGAVIICKDKSTLNQTKVKQQLSQSLNNDYYLFGREWPYKDVKRKILAEEFITDESGFELKDYKIFCFNGKPEFIQVDFNRFEESGHKRNLYSVNWEYLNFEYGYPTDASYIIKKPKNLSEMLELATIISKEHPFLRVDFYSVNGQTKFGEITFFPGSGLESFSNPVLDIKYGAMINLSTK